MKGVKFLVRNFLLMNGKTFLLCGIACIIIISSCRNDTYEIHPVDSTAEQKESFIFVSHLRTADVTVQHCDSAASLIPYKNYQLVLIGGDVTPDASANMSTLYYIDSIFDVKNPHTLWALGNHDYSSLANVSSITHRPSYYAYYYKGITFLVLDTQDSLSNMVGTQLQLVMNVTDTISESKHLIVLHHKLIWMYGNTEMQPLIDSIPNGGSGSCFWCTNPNNFYQDVYPLLLHVKNRGIDVMCLAGDVGFNTKQYKYTTSDGILFWACGMNAGDANDVAIVFSYSPETRTLTSTAKLVTDLTVH